ncbi:MAG: DUF1320 domain-containing protein [Verrucomicrobia bacterium]|nr:DUF1320 domain-containing protein [Verrucomicrobiota bacterium]
MADYITFAEMKAALPVEIMAQLLDDHGSGMPDMAKWAGIVAAVSREINAALEQKYTLPLGTVPNSVGHAAFTLAVELLYQGRGYYGDANPWTDRAREVRKWLISVASGATQLLPTVTKVNAPAVAITEPAKTTPSTGHILT